jgi:hypothetical protein
MDIFWAFFAALTIPAAVALLVRAITFFAVKKDERLITQKEIEEFRRK